MFILTYGLQSLQKSRFLIAGMVTDPGKSFKQFEVGVTELAFSIQHHQTFAFHVTWTLIYWSKLCMFLVHDEGRNGGGWVWWPRRRSKDWEKVEIDEEKEFGNQRKSLVDR